MAGVIALDSAQLPDVLPTDRLQTNGMCIPKIRRSLRRISNGRNALTIMSLWSCAVGTIWLVTWIDNPIAYLAAVPAMGFIYVRFAIQSHEAAHRLLFSNKRVNDLVGAWFVAYPAFVPLKLYRRAHLAHHRAEFGPDDPDLAFYGGYPCDRATLRRRLVRDAVGISGWKNFVPLLKSVTKRETRKVGLPILATQAMLWVVSGWATGRWWIYPLLWWLPWMTQWRVLNRLRSIAEHGGMRPDADRRATTHAVRQHWLARCLFVPYHTGWHLAHHVDMGIPWRNLPAFHNELAAAGYADDRIVYPNYRSLWRALSSS